MIGATWMVLHGGHAELTFIDYLTRVLLHLLAFTAIGGAAWWYLQRRGASKQQALEEAD